MATTIVPTSPDSLFGLQARALDIQARRLSLISGNLANADTPHFRPQDIDFRAALQAAQAGDLSAADAAAQPESTIQPSLDGNSVDSTQQQAAFADAALRYQASLNFIQARMRDLTTAITGN